MIIYIHDKNRARQHLVPRLVEVGLILSLVGDVLLMSKEMSSFLVGTGFFMTAHVLYIIAFGIGEKIKSLKRSIRTYRTISYFIVSSLLLLNIYTLWDLFPSKIIFVPYAVILTFEIIVCLARYEKTINSSFYFILIGAVLFTISDNLLGFLKFNHIRTDLGRLVIMLTYYGAQYFIMHGSLHQSNLIYEINKNHENSVKNY
jgi:uncharacterized membrane protein YhhN